MGCVCGCVIAVYEVWGAAQGAAQHAVDGGARPVEREPSAKLWDAAKAGLRDACAPATCADAVGVASVRKAREALGRLEAAVLDAAPWTLDRDALEDAGREVAAAVAAAARKALRTAGLAAADSVVVAGGAASVSGLRDALAPLGALRPPGKFAPADAVAVGATRFAERLLRKDGAALETAYLDEGVACCVQIKSSTRLQCARIRMF